MNPTQEELDAGNRTIHAYMDNPNGQKVSMVVRISRLSYHWDMNELYPVYVKVIALLNEIRPHRGYDLWKALTDAISTGCLPIKIWALLIEAIEWINSQTEWLKTKYSK